MSESVPHKEDLIERDNGFKFFHELQNYHECVNCGVLFLTNELKPGYFRCLQSKSKLGLLDGFLFSNEWVVNNLISSGMAWGCGSLLFFDGERVFAP